MWLILSFLAAFGYIALLESVEKIDNNSLARVLVYGTLLFMVLYCTVTAAN